MNTQPNVSTDVFNAAKLGPITLRNRVIKAATSEGRSPDGLVTDDLIDFHRSFAEGGVAWLVNTGISAIVGLVVGAIVATIVHVLPFGKKKHDKH